MFEELDLKIGEAPSQTSGAVKTLPIDTNCQCTLPPECKYSLGTCPP